MRKFLKLLYICMNWNDWMQGYPQFRYGQPGPADPEPQQAGAPRRRLLPWPPLPHHPLRRPQPDPDRQQGRLRGPRGQSDVTHADRKPDPGVPHARSQEDPQVADVAPR